MKRFWLLALFILSYFLFYSCSEESTNPKTGCDYTIDSRLAFLYDCPPGVDDCYEGTLSNAEKMRALDRLNFIRSIHGLPEVGYNPEQDVAVQKSALIAVANQALTHFPETTASCYTKLGYDACGQSNLHLSYYSSLSHVWTAEESIDGWINEKYSTSLGHRRWFLSPFLKNVAFGRVDRILSNGQYWVGSTMWVWDTDGETDANVDFVACPFHDYPSTAFQKDLIFSFSVLMNKTSQPGNKNVNFSTSTISVRDDNQNSYSVQNSNKDNDYYGLPNNLQWTVSGIDYNIRYNVTISNVNVSGQMKNYSYWFKLEK